MRKQILSLILASATLLLCSATSTSAQEASLDNPPNIVTILADDLGWADVGYNQGEIRTPHIDKLAKRGRRLDSFYVQPQCTPTRAALMTGKYPSRLGMHFGVILAYSQWGLPLQEVTLPTLLKGAGYRTAMVGKWHLGHHAQAYLPENRGFDHFYGCYLGSHDYFTHKHPRGGHDLHRNRKPAYDQGYATDLFGDEAVKIISNHDQTDPLFLYVAFNAPHDPWQAKPEDMDKYPKMQGNRRKYAGMVASMDDAIGRIVASLEDAGMTDNTLLVFCSDNGGPFAGDVTDNGPLRGGKGETYQGGVLVPALAVWPGQIPAGSVSNEMIYIGDLYPTFADIAGINLADRKDSLDGQVVTNTLIKGSPSGRRELALISGPDWFWNAVIQWPWKLNMATTGTLPQRLALNDGGRNEPALQLFNLKDDPYEATDLSADHPERVEKMRAVLDQHISSAVPSEFSLDQTKGVSPKVWGVFE
jgi:arylsulfatase A-like enzyme